MPDNVIKLNVKQNGEDKAGAHLSWKVLRKRLAAKGKKKGQQPMPVDRFKVFVAEKGFTGVATVHMYILHIYILCGDRTGPLQSLRVPPLLLLI